MQSFSEHAKHVCLIGDEMHIKEHLVFDKFSGELTGFINLGNVNDHLQLLEEQLNSSNDLPSPLPVLATLYSWFVEFSLA